MQERPFHGLHWFDPFGSVKFEHLCSVPPVPWDDRAVRYLFWDQEPLYPETVDSALAEFKKMYNGQHHLITSEHNSEFVERACNIYGFIPHYYFFHGWAALDWFRGYDRNFLIKPPGDRSITKTFITPNRIVAGQRQHRLYMLYHIFKSGMSNNWISCPAICPGENISLLDSVDALAQIYPDIRQVFAQQQLPINFLNESGHPMQSNRLDLFDESAQSLLYLVTETVATGRRQHLTEKTFKPICLRMPFIIVGTAGSLHYLRRYGFQTFSDLWDESYDLEVDDILRIEKISALLKDLDSMSQKEKQTLFEASNKICQHNFEHFYRGGFGDTLWKELTNMLKEFNV